MKARLRSTRTFLLAGTLLAIGAVFIVANAGAGKQAVTAPAPIIAGFENVNFVSQCRFTQRRPDDPIVLPGQPNMSHDHSFFGNFQTDAFSTTGSLRGQRTSCNRAGDTAAYWAPTLIVDNKAATTLDVAAYYRRSTLAPVKPFPADFVMVGGNSNAVDPQSLGVTFWNCSLAATNMSSTVPNCGDKSLRLHVIFPECWDGKGLDSPNHKAHMAYADSGVCPADHPVALPQLVLIIRYAASGAGNVVVASGGQYSGHADFMNAWDQAVLTKLVDYCLNALRPCGVER
jgi:hypothetical protein